MLKRLLFILTAAAFDLLLVIARDRYISFPIFIDTTGAILALLLFGLRWSLAEHVTFYAIMNLYDFSRTGVAKLDFLYSLAGFAIILSSWLFLRRRERFCTTVNNTFLFLLTTAFTSSIASVLAAGCVNAFLEMTDNVSHMNLYFVQTQFGSTLGLFLGRIPATLLDRVIVTFTAYGAYRLIKKITQDKNNIIEKKRGGVLKNDKISHHSFTANPPFSAPFLFRASAALHKLA